MKKGGWTVGDENTTTLINKDKDEEANRYSRKEKGVSGSIRAQRAGQLYGQAGDPNNQNCAIM